MKTRLFSTIFAVASLAGLAVAQRGNTVRVSTQVRDDAGHAVQGVSVKYYGPFGGSDRRSDFSNSTGRNGFADQDLMPGRYLIVAADDYQGFGSTTVDVTERSNDIRADLRLRRTRRPTIQFVLMSDDRNEPISNAEIEVFTNETGKRDLIRSRPNGLTTYEIPGSLSGGRFDVSIMSRDFDTVNKSITFRPRTDTTSMVYYVQMRRKTRLDDRSNPTRYNSGKLDGMIRLTTKNQIEVGDVAHINVGLLLSETRNGRGSAVSTVNISGPNGAGLNSDVRNVSLSLNDYANEVYDVRTNVPGVYTVRVSAVLTGSTGVQNAHWDSRFNFTVQPRNGRNYPQDQNVAKGDYVGNADIETDNSAIASHILSITLANGDRSIDKVKGWLSPRRGAGFHIQFEGTFDRSNNRLDATGKMMDREDKRWDIRVTGSPNRSGRMEVRLSIRARDDSYNKTFTFLLEKN